MSTWSISQPLLLLQISTICLIRVYPPGLSMSVASVIGWIPLSNISFTEKAVAPPEYEIGSVPPNSSERTSATRVEIGNSARPDIYRSSPGRTFLSLTFPSVFVSFTPKPRFSLFARSIRRLSIAFASESCKSCENESLLRTM